VAKRGKKKSKIRTEFRKKYDSSRRRQVDLTRDFSSESVDEDAAQTERYSGKGDLTRKRTIVGAEIEGDETSVSVHLDVDLTACLLGRVLSVHGLSSRVVTDEGKVYRCATRQLLKSLSTDQRNVVTTGDVVYFRPENSDEGLIERVEPRRGVLCRTSKGRQHVMVANVDQLLIVSSAAEPVLKPNLIDRMIVTAEKAEIRPVICVNKVDLVDPADLQPVVGVFAQMGYTVVLASAETGESISRLQRLLAGRQTVVAGQSGVGKSSLLNAVEEGLHLRVGVISTDNQKGRHTTTASQLIPLSIGGYVVDTPGVRQFQLWDVIPAEVAGFYRDVRPYVSRCRYPDCTHTHEAECSVKDAVADGRLDARRYESYCHLFTGDQ
jgi:ribosome biogenesis GTPase